MDQFEMYHHSRNCCKKHGCKYDSEDCPVVKGEIIQENTCDHGERMVCIPEPEDGDVVKYKRSLVTDLGDALKDLIENPTSIPKEKWGVHKGHCCVLHGCKYGNEDCPVTMGLVEQRYPCEDCSWTETAMKDIQLVNKIQREIMNTDDNHQVTLDRNDVDALLKMILK